jgi:hypothetical protein
MKFIIDIDGDKVTLGGLPTPAGGAAVPASDAPPPAPPASLLERARKLGALSAGAAQIGRGAALFATAMPGETLERVKPVEPAAPPAKRGRKRRAAR